MDLARFKWTLYTLLIIISCIEVYGDGRSNQLEQFLDLDQKFLLRWSVENGEKIYFEVEVETKGYIGFGVSPNGDMKNADMIIGGVRSDGSAYFSDRFGIGNTMPILDDRSDWFLTQANENETHTTLHFWRYLDSCDVQDFPIGKDTSRVIWACSPTDSEESSTDYISYHKENRGVLSINLLDPNPTNEDISKFKKWDVAMDMLMPHQETSYFCSIHKIHADKKYHIVGFDAILSNPDAVKHTHHFVVYKCVIPHELRGKMNNSVFEEHIGGPGNHCYLPDDEQTLPVRLCQTYLFVWGNGGRRILYPDHVGYPLSEKSGDFYFMLEIHFDNPEVLEGVRYRSGVEIYYTDKLRPYDSAMLTTGLVVSVAQTIPPNSVSFMSAGHCAPDCTRNFPPGGIKIFNVMLHSHLYGRKIKLRHFRNSTELPWILNDQNYDFASQQNRPLIDEAHVLPGDHLILECEYDTRGRNGLVTTGGLSTRHEMCQTFIWYYPKSTLEFCTSNYPMNDILDDMGIHNITYNQNEREPIVLEPEEMQNMNFSTAINLKVNWTEEFSSKMEARERFSEHEFFCSSTTEGLLNIGRINYPNLKKAYSPPNPCQPADDSENANSEEIRKEYRKFRDDFVNSFDRNGVRKFEDQNQNLQNLEQVEYHDYNEEIADPRISAKKIILRETTVQNDQNTQNINYQAQMAANDGPTIPKNSFFIIILALISYILIK